MNKPVRALIICLLLSFSTTSDAQSATPATAPVEGMSPGKGGGVSNTSDSTSTPSGANEKNNNPPSFKTLSVVNVSPNVVTWGQEVRVTLSNDPSKATLPTILNRDNLKAADLELFFNRVKIAKGATPGKGADLYFRLLNESETIRQVWKAASAREQDSGEIKGEVTVSFLGGAGRLESSADLSVKLYEIRRLEVSKAILFVLFVLFLLLAIKSDIVRDRAAPAAGAALPETSRRPYSLARCQMAFWTFIVLGSYLFIYAIMCDPRAILNQQALILLGIGVGTSLGATIIEAMREETNGQKSATIAQQIASLEAEAKGIAAEITHVEQTLAETNFTEVQKLAALQALTPLQTTLAEKRAQILSSQIEKSVLAGQAARLSSKNVLMDLLTDASGVSIHRFQMVAWTLVLGFVFLVEVMVNLVMPELDPMLLALMGISAGTYLGFKIPEKQAT